MAGRKPATAKPATGKPEADAGAAAGRPCPICGKAPTAKYVPFCSKRCADVDLHRWLGGVYAVPSEEQPDDGELPPPERGEP